jgi:glycosyltransferase involved in cell wall biosynthesis
MRSTEMDAVIGQYLTRTKPDLMHIHSRFGLPASMSEIAHRKGISVVNTIHVYGYICQKRVMIDREGEPCCGPDDVLKCAECTGILDYRRERFRARSRRFKERLKQKSPRFFNTLLKIKARMRMTGRSGQPLAVQATSGRSSDDALKTLAERLAVRLKYCVDMLNDYSDRVICVSSDVKVTLSRYGVRDDKMLVQHIGSTIAERQTIEDRPLHKPLVVGNIGGVNHYKGTHILVEAAAKTKNKEFLVLIYGKYVKSYVDQMSAVADGIPLEFMGRYEPEGLAEILKHIDVMVLPSICNDTAPQTIFESFSGGVPIIASNIGGFPDFVHHEKNGLLFEAGNSADLAEKIDYVLSHSDKIGEFRKNIPRLKTIDDNAKELIALYRELLRDRRAIAAIK